MPGQWRILPAYGVVAGVVVGVAEVGAESDATWLKAPSAPSTNTALSVSRGSEDGGQLEKWPSHSRDKAKSAVPCEDL